MPHRDAFPKCPACGSALDARGARLCCDGCDGVLVAIEELRQMLRDINPDERRTLEQLVTPVGTSRRTCPRCTTPMSSCELNQVPLDLCAHHGFWFDRNELVTVLQGDVTPEQFAAEFQARQAMADQMEFGSGGSMLVRLFQMLFKR
jgi:Zn-finger nucleic acid-binding protein